MFHMHLERAVLPLCCETELSEQNLQGTCMIDGLFYFLGTALGALVIPILWVGFFLRSPWAGAISGGATAALLSWGGNYVGQGFNPAIVAACILDGVLFGFLGRKLLKAKKNKSDIIPIVPKDSESILLRQQLPKKEDIKTQ